MTAAGAAHRADHGGWSDPAFARIATRLHAEAGLVFPATRRSAVEGSLRRVRADAGLDDLGALADAVDAGGPVLDAVIAALTIGETYFFREPRQLDFLRDRVLPSLGARDAGRPLRLWSAGCSSGEEPYTLAMLLRESGWRGPARIVGTDLSSERLAHARRARYTRWSFRGVPERIVTQYFTAERRQFVLRPDVRAAVEFRVLNLAEDAYPSTASGVFEMDVVLCRNVMIYFDAETVRRVAERLLASLSDDGWLLLGASDPALGGLVPCEVVVTEAGLAYRRPRDGGAAFDAVAAWAAGQTPRAGAPDATPGTFARADGALSLGTPAPDALSSGTPAPAEAPVSRAATLDDAERAYAAADYAAAASFTERADASPRAAVLRVRALANLGRLDEAGAACAAALDAHPDDAELAYLHALLLAQARRWRPAADAVRRALYLDRRLVVAHMLLGDVLAQLGHRPDAARAYRNAETLLAALPADANVPAADGVPAARLLHAARAGATRNAP